MLLYCIRGPHNPCMLFGLAQADWFHRLVINKFSPQIGERANLNSCDRLVTAVRRKLLATLGYYVSVVAKLDLELAETFQQ